MKDSFSFNMEQSFDNLYKGGAFFTVGDGNKANTMEISWGTIGYMWKRPIFMAMIRESRYSNEFLGKDKTFTVSIPFDGNMKKELSICGTKSGRDIDKEKEANIKFVKSRSVEAPVIDNCQKYYECKIIFKQELNLDNMSKEMQDMFYPAHETKHILYFGEIVESYDK